MKHKIYKALLATAVLAFAMSAPAQQSTTDHYLRANHIGYLNDDIKAAVYLGPTDPAEITFKITAPDISVSPDSVVATTPWQPFEQSARIYFSSLNIPGEYQLTAYDTQGNKLASAPIKIGNDVYSRLALHEMPLNYLRQQRCGYNPTYDSHCHQHDGILVLAGDNTGRHVDVTGGWHDASDYLQYLTTSANTVYQMLFAYEQSPEIWADQYDALGRKGGNGVADILDEARWGLEWMIKMNPADTLFLNQIADDRDHKYVGLPANDSVDYGWGNGKERPVYPCYGKPYGLSKYRNESTGLASSVGKFASSFGLGAHIFADIDPTFASELERRSANAYNVAVANPGACQTASTVSPYYYEEDNYADDMTLAAMERYRANPNGNTLKQALDYMRLEPITPWMGADSAHHYQWYPFINLGIYNIASKTKGRPSAEALRNMQSGIERVAQRGADNAFLNGIPFIWCSNNLTVAFVTQAMLYRNLTGNNRYREVETAMRDWLFGVNPWGQTMVILPVEMHDGYVASPQDPHSATVNMTVNERPGRESLIGGLVDGPVYANIFNSLWGVHLRAGYDRMQPFQNSTVVYHDDFSDYSTNEPTMDGTASLSYILGQLSKASKKQ